MENIMKVSTELGYMKVPKNTLVDINRIKGLPKNKQVIVTTGSQGEEMSALYRMAFSQHKQVEIGAGDKVIISASAIPGNEVTVSRVINELFRKGEVPPAPADWSLGQRVPRVDVEEKVTGTGIYPDDIYLDGMIYGSAVRAQYPRARVLAIHTEEARALPGVVGVFTAEDIPGQNKVGHLVKDWDTMIAVGDITHYLGDAICLVAAETPEILAQAKALVKVDYEELPMVRSPREAMLPDAPLVHRTGNLLTHKHIQRGNPAEAIAKSKHVLTQHFSTPWTEHAFLEPECAVAYPDGDGVMILSTDQGAYDTQHETMGMLGLPAEKVKVRNCLVGGGFGGKEDVTVQIGHTTRPATRQEAFTAFVIFFGLVGICAGGFFVLCRETSSYKKESLQQ